MMSSSVDGVEDAISCCVKALAKAMVVPVLVVVSHIAFVLDRRVDSGSSFHSSACFSRWESLLNVLRSKGSCALTKVAFCYVDR